MTQLAVTVAAGVRTPRAVAALVGDLSTDVLGDDRREDVELAVHEIVVNAIRHGPDAPVDVRATTGPGALDVEVIDRGQGGIPTVPDEPPPAVGAIGGRGVAIARALCDELVWRRTDDGHLVHLAFRVGDLPDLVGPEVDED